MVRMRCAGRCLLLLLLLSLGGLLAHVSVRDAHRGHNAGVGGAIAGGVLVSGGSYQVGVLRKMQMRPVPVSEFQARLRTVRNKFDLLRIFLADKDISDESLMRLLTASMVPHSHAWIHADVRSAAVTSLPDDVDLEDKYTAVTPSDLNIKVGGGSDVRTDPEKQISSKGMRSKPKNASGKEGSESTEAVIRKGTPKKDSNPEDGVSLSKEDKLKSDLPKDVALPVTKDEKKVFLHNKGAEKKSTTVTYEASASKPVTIDAAEFSTQRPAQLRNDVKEHTSSSVSDVSSEVKTDISPFSFKTSDIKNKISDLDSSFSDVKVSSVETEARKDAPPLSVKVSNVKNVRREMTSSVDLLVSDVKRDKAYDGVRLSQVHKRAEYIDDDDDEYEEEEEELNEEDYLDGETDLKRAVDYHNDAAHADDIYDELLEEALHHVAEMEDNPQKECRDPLPQVVHIQDPKRQGRRIFPDCTVIHRCRSDSGCCDRDHECGPKAEQKIVRTFFAMKVNNTSGMVVPYTDMLEPHMFERITLVNHTQCQCRPKPRLPECTQACPGVFRMYRYGDQCVCDCHSSANERFPQCDDVKEGLKPLTEEDLECIKFGTCGMPRCSQGQLDIKSGFCPLKDGPSIPSSLLRRQYHQRHQPRRQSGPPASSASASSASPSSSSQVPVEGSGDY